MSATGELEPTKLGASLNSKFRLRQHSNGMEVGDACESWTTSMGTAMAMIRRRSEEVKTKIEGTRGPGETWTGLAGVYRANRRSSVTKFG